jgi:hypothetical protein
MLERQLKMQTKAAVSSVAETAVLMAEAPTMAVVSVVWAVREPEEMVLTSSSSTNWTMRRKQVCAVSYKVPAHHHICIWINSADHSVNHK